MVGVSVHITGLREVVRAMEQLGVDLDDIKDAMAGIAAKGSQLAAQKAPRVSGRLATSIRGNRAKGKAVVTAGRASVPYAGAINYGWPSRNIAPALFLQNAEEELAPQAVQMLEDGVNRQIKKRGLA